MSNELATTERQIQATEEPLSPAELVRQVQHIQEMMAKVMHKGEHYGTIPGCGPKPVLFKAGAEKLQLTFRLHPDFEIHETDLPESHKTFRVTCRMQNQSGGFQGAGVGYGSTKETKYSKGKQNPADYYNTALKMAKKRAQVDAVLTCTAASDIFTQDLEDMPSETLPKDNYIAKKFPASQENDRGSRPPSTEPLQRASDPPAPESTLEWRGVIQDVVKHQGENARGPWTLFRINMEDGNTAMTFDEALAKDAEIMIGQEVRVLYEVNKRKPGTFTYLGFKPIESITQQPAEELPWQ